MIFLQTVKDSLIIALRQFPLIFTLGAITLLLWGIRFFVFKLFESPRFLVGIGKDAEAVEVIRKIAEFNGKSTNLTVEQLINAGGMDPEKARQANTVTNERTRVLSKSSYLGWKHVKALFRTKKMAFSTSLLIFLWGIIGLASTLYNSFLPFLLESRGNAFGDGSLFITYRNTHRVLLHKPSSSVSWVYPEPSSQDGQSNYPTSAAKAHLQFHRARLTGAFLFATTTARSSNALLGWNCGYTFFSNIMYGVLYAISPEIFPAKDRGTGNGLVSSATRIFSVIAPIIALYANLETATPVYISGALIILTGLVALLLPYEPRGKASI
ncbi:MFS general substrate transporter [Gymnopus androsaceus JB14]|uniref:MFS general substrate transporter n=1 Tax=Gymnopus androsaceus JB14 TaxID=1447944 RepID=A0A6A4GDX5_9AGAR|nr:MFS general substrate transporter [Gymnopus androsaceus JB14]